MAIHPLIPTLEAFRSQLKIYPHQLDKNMLKLTFFSRDRFLGAAFLNHLMQSYHHFLKTENDAVCRQQLGYLEQRREELTSYYEKSLQEHSAYLSENLIRHGFMGFEQEIKTLSEPKHLYTAKLFEIELELKRLGAPQEISLHGGSTKEEIFHVEEQIEEASFFSQFRGTKKCSSHPVSLQRSGDSHCSPCQTDFLLNERGSIAKGRTKFIPFCAPGNDPSVGAKTDPSRRGFEKPGKWTRSPCGFKSCNSPRAAHGIHETTGHPPSADPRAQFFKGTIGQVPILR